MMFSEVKQKTLKCIEILKPFSAPNLFAFFHFHRQPPSAVAKLVNARDFDSRIRWFKPNQPSERKGVYLFFFFTIF